MPLYVDRVQETTATTGTGTVNLAGASTGYQSFASAFAVGAHFYYTITDGTNWEVGMGTLATGTTLSRDIVYASSNAGALVNFPAGNKNVFCDLPAKAITDQGISNAILMGGLIQ